MFAALWAGLLLFAHALFRLSFYCRIPGDLFDARIYSDQHAALPPVFSLFGEISRHSAVVAACIASIYQMPPSGAGHQAWQTNWRKSGMFLLLQAVTYALPLLRLHYTRTSLLLCRILICDLLLLPFGDLASFFMRCIPGGLDSCCGW